MRHWIVTERNCKERNVPGGKGGIGKRWTGMDSEGEDRIGVAAKGGSGIARRREVRTGSERSRSRGREGKWWDRFGPDWQQCVEEWWGQELDGQVRCGGAAVATTGVGMGGSARIGGTGKDWAVADWT